MAEPPAPESSGSRPRRYAAFLSYSHHDEAWARWLQRRIEGYRVPRDLVGSAGRLGPVPARLGAVFRDREDLPTAADLGDQVRRALADSDALVVLCSPAAARSPWVQREIVEFRAMHGDGAIHALIVAGEPNSGGGQECFPAALRAADAAAAEPAAADARRSQDGSSLALLKLLAGLLGVDLDALRRREHQRQRRRLLLAAAAAIAVALATSWLAVTAMLARGDAERRLAQGEGLVDFMLTDLKGQLESVQRLDALDTVGQRVIEHLRALPARDQTAAALARRGQALRQIGELHLRRLEWPQALAIFTEARAMDLELLARAPDDPQRRYDLAQSEFWIGNVHLHTGRLDEAASAFASYLDHAIALNRLDPARLDWLLEVGFGHVNAATVAERQRRPDLALDHARRGVAVFDQARSQAPDDPAVQVELANALAWLGDAQAATGDFRAALASHDRAAAISRALEAATPGDIGLAWLTATRIRGHAHALSRTGNGPAARRLLDEAAQRLAALVRHDPANREWRKVQLNLAGEQIRVAAGSGALATLPSGIAELAGSAATEPLAWRPGEEAVIRAWHGYYQASTGAAADGAAALDQAANDLRRDFGQGHDVYTDLLEVELLRLEFGAGPLSTALIEGLPAADDAGLDWRRASLVAAAWIASGNAEAARPLVRRLLAGGYAEASFIARCRAAALCPER
jgi:tetratricopeptide (TPR) repeat protein